jgi:hypothetical protein
MEEPTPKRISLRSVRPAIEENMGDEECKFGAGRGNALLILILLTRQRLP